jgi:FkbM family methyltransferase
VIAFEPVPANADLLRRNAAANGFSQLEINQLAVADRVGTGRLVLAEYSGGAVLDSAPPPPDACGFLEVELVSLDSWLAGQTNLVPSFVKIDVEGTELEVLRGMQAALRGVKPVILLEVDDANEEKAAAKTKACRDYLEGFDYSVEQLPDGYPDIEWHVIHLLAKPFLD